mgnify:CR=1 FL=1
MIEAFRDMHGEDGLDMDDRTRLEWLVENDAPYNMWREGWQEKYPNWNQYRNPGDTLRMYEESCQMERDKPEMLQPVKDWDEVMNKHLRSAGTSLIIRPDAMFLVPATDKRRGRDEEQMSRIMAHLILACPTYREFRQIRAVGTLSIWLEEVGELTEERCLKDLALDVSALCATVRQGTDLVSTGLTNILKEVRRFIREMALLSNLPGAQDRVRGSLPQLETFQGASKALVARTLQRELGKEVWAARPNYRERQGAAELWWLLQLIRSAADSDISIREGLFARYRSTSGYRRGSPETTRKRPEVCQTRR